MPDDMTNLCVTNVVMRKHPCNYHRENYLRSNNRNEEKKDDNANVVSSVSVDSELITIKRDEIFNDATDYSNQGNTINNVDITSSIQQDDDIQEKVKSSMMIQNMITKFKLLSVHNIKKKRHQVTLTKNTQQQQQHQYCYDVNHDDL